jgi:hypothetical protein
VIRRLKWLILFSSAIAPALLYLLHPVVTPTLSCRRGSTRAMQPIVFISLKTCVDTHAQGNELAISLNNYTNPNKFSYRSFSNGRRLG